MQPATQDDLEFPREFPSGPLSLDSPLYVERQPIEQLAYAEISKPSSLLRIKAARSMGKSSLLNRLLAHAEAQNCRLVQLDFQEADEQACSSLNRLLRWISINASHSLQLKLPLEDYWDSEVGSKMSCSLYWHALLSADERPLVLALNNIDLLFDRTAIARDFLSLLRSWYEKSKQTGAWQKLRLVVVYSTEAYVPLDINQSPFNVGLPLKLPPFTLAQVKELADRYELSWYKSEIGGLRLAALQQLTGGHPYLVNLALYHVCRAELPPEELLQRSTTASGIYADHLRRLLSLLQAEPNLEDAFKQIISVDAPIRLDPASAYKLDGLGLVTLQGDRVTASCELYRLYFREKLCSYREVMLKLDRLNRAGIRVDSLLAAARLSEADQSLEHLEEGQLDQMTQLMNRQQFEAHLKTEWQRASQRPTELALIWLDIDYFKVYNETHGETAGDQCLQQLTGILRQVIQRPHDLVARYGGEEFVLLLPQTDLDDAAFVAETICAQVAALEIACGSATVDGLPSSVLTVSAGVASIVPPAGSSPAILLDAASHALYQSKRQGGNRATAVKAAEQWE
ncbi:MAG: AAA-like domain-containing protein [Pegethrix bostrychoides GSE-TBD4-15B]|uniref:AAA-like domain-containing protein n=1 Tax=Pegethrix bostrychoides GSE-TBD4-15B TaxID=2839662 RepID=A0A951PEL8_9CYAN|nr:AAA-like domain-containing protein [Pegethrix bostrychoides GSE-TBD4-15B]